MKPPQPNADGTLGVLYCDVSPAPSVLRCAGCECDLVAGLAEMLAILEDPSLMPMCEPCADDLIEFCIGTPEGLP